MHIFKMAVLYLLCATLLIASTKAQCLPFSTPVPQVVSPCQQVVSPCQAPVVSTTPVVATTVVDNSVSNALANALQLLIVSNLIENTMTGSCGCGLNTLPSVLPSVTPLCDAIPVQASMYSPAIDVISPSYVPYDPIPVITPCDVISSCEPIIEVIPNNYYPEVVSVSNAGCGCGCDGPYMSNFGANYGPNFGCGNCGNCGNSLSNILSNFMPNIGSPNLGCGCKNFGYDINPFGPKFGCDSCGPMIPDFFPGIPAPSSCGCGYGMPNLPIAVNVEPFGYDSCPNKCYGNSYYF